MLFLINVVITVATFWNAVEDHSKAYTDFRETLGPAKAKALRKLVLLWIVPLLSIAAIPLTWSEQTESERKISELKRQAGDATLQVATLTSSNLSLAMSIERFRSNNLSLEKRVLRLKNPNKVTDEQRSKFIAISLEPYNVSKIPIEVIVGGNEKETERFAFQIRKVLNEGGYGELPSPYRLPTTKMEDGSLYVTNAVSSLPVGLNLEPFEFGGLSLTIKRGLSVSSVPKEKIVTPSFSVGGNPDSTLLRSISPYSSSEPNVIALFSGDLPNQGIIPSFMVLHPVDSNANRGEHYMYAKTTNPNAILYGVCEALCQIGITVGMNTTTNILPPGKVGIFIPSP